MEQHDNITLPQDAQVESGGISSIEMPVRWGDLDALNHVNNTLYFRYLEEARVRCFTEAGVGVAGSGRDFVLAHTSCDFLRPVHWPATIQIRMRLSRFGRSSVEFDAELHVLGDTGGPCARARSVIVGTRSETGRSEPWTSEERENLLRVFGAAE